MDDGLGVVGTQETEIRNSLKFWIMDEDENYMSTIQTTSNFKHTSRIKY